MLSKLFAIALCMTMMLLTGCNKSSDTYDDVGESRVFDDQPVQTAKAKSQSNGQAQESVPAPLPLTELAVAKAPPAPAKQTEVHAVKKVAESARPARHVLIGEMDIDN